MKLRLHTTIQTPPTMILEVSSKTCSMPAIHTYQSCNKSMRHWKFLMRSNRKSWRIVFAKAHHSTINTCKSDRSVWKSKHGRNWISRMPQVKTNRKKLLKKYWCITLQVQTCVASSQIISYQFLTSKIFLKKRSLKNLWLNQWCQNENLKTWSRLLFRSKRKLRRRSRKKMVTFKAYFQKYNSCRNHKRSIWRSKSFSTNSKLQTLRWNWSANPNVYNSLRANANLKRSFLLITYKCAV